MAKKSLGYVQLEWTCPNCDTRNPGPQKTCLSCGMPQPDDVTFDQPAQETLIEDEAKLAQAKSGPDIHCRYCGSRNSATATNCSQCGADLSEGAKRESGQMLGVYRDKEVDPIECASCGTLNTPAAAKCIQCGAGLTSAEPPPGPKPEPKKATPKKGLGMATIIGIVALVLIVCAACITLTALFNRTEDVGGTVQNVEWTRTIEIEGLVPVEHQAWHDDIPAEAVVGGCRDKVRRTQDNPAPNSREVCGTPYTVDTGSGYGEVVQECRYEVFENYCDYTVEEWQEVDEEQLTGNDFSPRWPNPALRQNQREGNRDETYTCIFTTESGQYSYVPGNQAEFARCEMGSRWVLQVNTFGIVTDIQPR